MILRSIGKSLDPMAHTSHSNYYDGTPEGNVVGSMFSFCLSDYESIRQVINQKTVYT